MATCSIIPPYLLEALATSGDPLLEGRAQRTLDQDAALRGQRPGATAAPPRVTEPSTPPDSHVGASGPSRTVHDADGLTRLPGRPVRVEGGPETGDAAVDEAYAGLGATFELWFQAYGRDSLDGKGLALLATVHYGRDYDNAFWDGDQLVFGDGDGVIFARFTASLDVIGHELAHGVTQYTSGLVYRGQPGALNEHVSDVFGVLAVQRLRHQGAAEADWLIGADLLLPGVAGVALRSMREPGTAYDDPRLGRDPQPAHMDDFVVTRADYGGVHINSGIPNRAFVLAASALGGYAWEQAGQIWYDTITGDIAADCDFATFAALTEDAAGRRYGTASVEQQAVRAAWQTVGVTGVRAARSAPTDPSTHRDTGAGDAEVTVRRTGGFAGTQLQGRFRVSELADPDAAAWRELLTGRELGAAAARTDQVTRPDAFWYSVCCDAPVIDVDVPERALTEGTRALLEQALRAGSPGR